MVDTLRVRKRARTRRALADAALNLFERQGFANTTVDEICERADVSPATFFRYFGDKESVAFPDNLTRLDVARQALEAAAGRPVARLRAACHALAEHDIADRELLARRARLIADDEALARRAAYEEGRMRTLATRAMVDVLGDASPRDHGELRLHLLVSAALTAADYAWHAWLEAGARGDLHAEIDRAFDVLEACSRPARR
jgi:AcrR family transcriptional regulator